MHFRSSVVPPPDSADPARAHYSPVGQRITLPTASSKRSSPRPRSRTGRSIHLSLVLHRLAGARSAEVFHRADRRASKGMTRSPESSLARTGGRSRSCAAAGSSKLTWHRRLAAATGAWRSVWTITVKPLPSLVRSYGIPGSPVEEAPVPASRPRGKPGRVAAVDVARDRAGSGIRGSSGSARAAALRRCCSGASPRPARSVGLEGHQNRWAHVASVRAVCA